MPFPRALSITEDVPLHIHSPLRRGGSLSIHRQVRATRGPATWKRNEDLRVPSISRLWVGILGGRRHGLQDSEHWHSNPASTNYQLCVPGRVIGSLGFCHVSNAKAPTCHSCCVDENGIIYGKCFARSLEHCQHPITTPITYR